MTKWRALAWDDEAREDYPDHILNKIKTKLLQHSMEVAITQEVDQCYLRFKDDGPWDLLILDIIDEKSDPENPDTQAGPKLAARIRALQKDIPIVFLTSDEGVLIRGEIVIDGPILLKSKFNASGTLVIDILDFIRVELFSKTKVFLIWGHSRKADGFKGKVKARLMGHGLELVEISPEAVMKSLTESLVVEMATCGAFVAICTPDDKVGDNWYQPRQNVLLEIGMAAGLRRGFERLIILQRWGEEAEVQAQLPSDLGSILAIRFVDDHEEALERLVKALIRRGMQFS